MPECRFEDLASPTLGTRETADGYLVADVRCAKTGCQTYMATDLGLGQPGTITVFRPEEVVFDKGSLSTFAGKPVTLGHPPEMVTADNWRNYAVGDIGEDILRDGDYIRVPIKLMDAKAIQAVKNGTRQISMGYTTGFELRDGVAPDGTAYQAVQTGPIRINHLAVVPAARGGPNLRIGDSADTWGASPVTTDHRSEHMPEGIKTRIVLVDGLSVETTDAGAQALEKLMKDAATRQAAHDQAMALKDADLARKDKEVEDLKAKVLDSAALNKMVADRVDLITKAKGLHAGLVTDGKDASAIRRDVVSAVKGQTMVADKSDAYIEALFDLLVADAAKADPVAKAVADAASTPARSVDIYAQRDEELRNAWKKGK